MTDTRSGPLTMRWTQGQTEQGKHWVHCPGVAGGINAHSAIRAATIVRSVNAAPMLLAALEHIAQHSTDPHARHVAADALAKERECL